MSEKLQTECLTVRHLFWEFYAQNHLWFYIGSGKETYNYPVNHILPRRLTELIDTRFENTTNLFFELIKEKLEASIRSEMKYAFSPDWGNFCDATNHTLFETKKDCTDKSAYLRAESDFALFLQKQGISYLVPANKAPIEWARVAFSWKGWNESYCGKPWAQACSVLLDASKNKTLKDRVFWIDTSLDLYHNSGFLMNKTAFAALEMFDDLGARAELKSWPEVASYEEKIYDDVIINDGEDKAEIHQQLYPLSFRTRGLITRYKALI